MIDQVERFISDPWHVQPHIDAFKDMSLRYAIESSSDHQKAIKHHTACWAAAEKLLAEKRQTSPAPLLVAKPKPSPTPDSEEYSYSEEEEEEEMDKRNGRQSHSREAARSRSRDSAPAAAWATFDRDATVWKQELERAGVDDNSQRVLFLLAQHSHQGHQEANRILHKLFKDPREKGKGGSRVGNVSAFVSVAVRNARVNLDYGTGGKGDKGGKGTKNGNGNQDDKGDNGGNWGHWGWHRHNGYDERMWSDI